MNAFESLLSEWPLNLLISLYKFEKWTKQNLLNYSVGFIELT